MADKKKFIKVNDKNIPVHDTAFGYGARFNGVHYKAMTLGGLEAELKRAAKSNPDGFKSNRKWWQLMSALVFLGGLAFLTAGVVAIVWTLQRYGTGGAAGLVFFVLIAAVVAGSGKPGPGQ